MRSQYTEMLGMQQMNQSRSQNLKSPSNATLIRYQLNMRYGGIKACQMHTVCIALLQHGNNVVEDQTLYWSLFDAYKLYGSFSPLHHRNKCIGKQHKNPYWLLWFYAVLLLISVFDMQTEHRKLNKAVNIFIWLLMVLSPYTDSVAIRPACTV